MGDKEKHINNWNLPEHHPKAGLWKDIEKELDEPIASVGFKDSLNTLPLHNPKPGLWNDIDNQLNKASAVVYFKTLYKYVAPFILLLLAGFLVYYFLFISKDYQTENPDKALQNNSRIFKENASEFKPEENHNIKEKESAKENNNLQTNFQDKNFIIKEPELQINSNINVNNILPENSNPGNLEKKPGQISPILFSTNSEKILKVTKIPVSENKNEKFILQRNSNFNLQRKDFKGDNNFTLKNFYTGFHFMPEYIYRKNGNVDVQRANNFDLSLGYKFSKVFIESGLGLSFTQDDGTYAINYLQNEWINTYTKVDSIIYNFDSISQTLHKHYINSDVDVYDSIEYAGSKQTLNRYTYLRIPFVIGYKFDYRKVSLFLKGGTVFSVLLKGDEPVPTVNGKEVRIININRLSPGRLSTNWQIMLSAGINIQAHKSLSLTLEPQYRYYLNSYYSQQMNKYKKPYSIGIRAGVLINF